MDYSLKFGRSSMAVICCGLAGTGSLAAQSQGGLYAATGSNQGGRDQLNVEWWLGEAFTSGLPAELRSFVVGGDTQGTQPSTVVAASVNYARNRHSMQLFGTGSTFFRYGGSVNHLATVSQYGEFGAGFRLPSNGRLTVSQSATYSPPYLYELFPTSAPLALGEVAPVNPVYRTDSSLYRTSALATFGSARGTQVTTTADYSLTNFHQQVASALDLSTYSVGAKVSQALSRSSGISGGYSYQTGDFTLGGRTEEHRFTVGAAFSPAVSARRRATLHVDLSPSVVQSPAANGSVERQSHFQGEAGVEYPFRPKWRASLSYRRAVDYLIGFTEPTLSTGTRVEVTGVIAHRIDLKAIVGRATGSSAVSANFQNLGTSTGQIRVRYALSRKYALFSEYLYSSYDLSRQIGLGSDLPAAYRIHEVRFGFTGFTPVLGR